MEVQKYPTSSKDMAPIEAHWLFENGATVVILDMPKGFEFGIDCNQWTIGEHFKGVKMIPPGFHIIYYSSVSKRNEVSPRTSFMYHFKPREVLVKRWNALAEDLDDCKEEVERVESNKKELDKFLGVYPYESYKKWVSLTDHIKETAIENIVPLSGRIFSVVQFQSEASNSQDRLKKKEEIEKIEINDDSNQEISQKTELHDVNGMVEMDRMVGSELRFMQIPDLKQQGTLTSAQVSLMGMDHSYKLFSIIASHGMPRILAEVQLVFVCFLVGQVYDAFEQWKRLVDMFCSCDEAVSRHSDLFDKFIGMLHYQVKEISEDFFIDIVTKDNFLYDSLSKFFDNVKESSCTDHLKGRTRRFRSHLEKKFKYSFELDVDEYAPVLVEGV